MIGTISQKKKIKLTEYSAEPIDEYVVTVNLLEDWNLLSVVDEVSIKERIPMNQVKIITFAEKDEWELVPKYNIGNSNKEAI